MSDDGVPNPGPSFSLSVSHTRSDLVDDPLSPVRTRSDLGWEYRGHRYGEVWMSKGWGVDTVSTPESPWSLSVDQERMGHHPFFTGFGTGPGVLPRVYLWGFSSPAPWWVGRQGTGPTPMTLLRLSPFPSPDRTGVVVAREGVHSHPPPSCGHVKGGSRVVLCPDSPTQYGPDYTLGLPSSEPSPSTTSLGRNG